jgi:hypothetical protein
LLLPLLRAVLHHCSPLLITRVEPAHVGIHGLNSCALGLLARTGCSATSAAAPLASIADWGQTAQSCDLVSIFFFADANILKAAAQPRNKCGFSIHGNSGEHAVQFISVFWPSIFEIHPVVLPLQCKQQPTYC